MLLALGLSAALSPPTSLPRFRGTTAGTSANATAAAAAAAALAAGVEAGDPAALAQAAAAGTLSTISDAEALTHDLHRIASQHGWTFEQALAQHRAGEAVGAVAVAIAETAPEVFIGSALAEEPGAAPTLYVKGPASAEVRALVAHAGHPIVVEDNHPFSFDELNARKAEVTDALIAMGYANFATGFQLTGRGVVRATVQRKAGLPDHATAVVNGLPERLQNRVALEVTDAQVVKPEAAVFGGMQMYDDANVFQCTSAFTAYRESTGTTGIVTAAHCNTPSSVPGSVDHVLDTIVTPEGHDYAWDLFSRHIGRSDQPETYQPYGEIMWGTTGTVESAAFYASTSQILRPTSVEPRANITVGESVCGFGRISGAKPCQDVSWLSVDCYVDSGDFPRNLVQVEGFNYDRGDSGGPRFLGNKAFGSHFGDCEGGEAFSAADWYDNALGIRVRLTQTLANRMRIYSGDKLTSTDGRFTATMQSDGNFVLYKNGVGALWSTGTNGNSGAYLTLHQEGYLSVRRADGTVIWSTNTSGGGFSMTLQNDGNLVLRNSSGGAVWASNTCCH